MSRHSKNNTASSVFTYHERQQLNYGSKKNRLGADSLRNFDACFLCLQTARDPLCCPKGHLSCKECIYENIISQKKKMARQQKETESILALREAVTEEKETAAQQALLEEFERSQTHFLPMSRLSKHEKEETDGETKTPDEKDEKDYNLVDTSSGKVFQIDVDEMAARAKQERDRAMAILEKEEAEKNKPKLPSFWIPSLTPAAMPAVLPVIKKETECTASKHPHPITIKKLIPVKFATAESSKKSTNGNIVPSEKICPSCTKTIMNSTKLAISKSCGHVLCKSCVEKFTVKSGRCFVCNAKCREKDLIEMTGEGTGFSAGGKAEAVREDVAFQC